MLLCALYVRSVSLVLFCVIFLVLLGWSNGKSSTYSHLGTVRDESNEVVEDDISLSTTSITTIADQAVRSFNGEKGKIPKDLTLLGTADGMLHAIDDETSEKLWSVDTGGPLVSSSTSSSHSKSSATEMDSREEDKREQDHNFKDSVTVLPTVDGSLYMDSGQGMRKTSVKARLLAEKAPFMSKEGDMLFSSEKTSRILDVDLDSGDVIDLSSGSVTHGINGRGRVGSTSSNLKPVGSRKSLWMGRVE